MTNDNRGAMKKEGQQAAKTWCETATLQDQIKLAGADLDYGEILDDLRFDGLHVPTSHDPDFSWGFFEHVKGRVHHALYKRQK